VAHNLGTEAIHVTVRENVSSGYLLSNYDDYSIQTSTSQSVIVTRLSGTVPTAGWAVMISSAGPTSAFQAHTHTIAQVVSLQDILNTLSNRLDVVEALVVPGSIPASSSTTKPYEIPLASHARVLFSNNLGVWGTQEGVLKITSVPSGQPPQMLEALSVTATTAASSAIPTATTVDIVQVYTSGLNILVPRIGLIPGARLPSGVAHIGAESARSLVYQVQPEGTDKTFYPKPYEVTLFEVPLNDKVFRAGTKARVQFDLTVQSHGANGTAQWFCVIDAGTVTSASSPATQGSNLTDLSYNSTPILAQSMLVTGDPVTHELGAEILATTTTILTANSFAYGVYSPVTAGAPGSRNCVLRARLARFDVVDTQGDARGWVGYALRPYDAAEQIKLIVE
jgi:hypothetical protein